MLLGRSPRRSAHHKESSRSGLKAITLDAVPGLEHHTFKSVLLAIEVKCRFLLRAVGRYDPLDRHQSIQATSQEKKLVHRGKFPPASLNLAFL